MRKQISLDIAVYEQLDTLRGKRESFSQLVERLVKVYKTLFEVAEVLGPAHYLAERPKNKEVKD